MGLLFDLGAVLAVVLVILKAGEFGLPPWAPYVIVPLGVGAVFLRATGRLIGGVFGHVVRLAFTIGLPVVSVLFFVMRFGLRGHGLAEASYLFLVFLVVLGLYVILFGGFTSTQGILWSIPSLFSLTVFALTLGACTTGGLEPPASAWACLWSA